MKTLITPVKDNKTLLEFKAGEILTLSGNCFTMRDAVHKKAFDLLSKNQALPFDLNGAAIYYTGASTTPKGTVIGSIGPTTSARMDKYTPLLLKHGVKVMIGKGSRSSDVQNAIKEHNAIYLLAVGGCGALVRRHITSAKIIAYPELLSEAVSQLNLDRLPLIVAIDSYGNSIF